MLLCWLLNFQSVSELCCRWLIFVFRVHSTVAGSRVWLAACRLWHVFRHNRITYKQLFAITINILFTTSIRSSYSIFVPSNNCVLPHLWKTFVYYLQYRYNFIRYFTVRRHSNINKNRFAKKKKWFCVCVYLQIINCELKFRHLTSSSYIHFYAVDGDLVAFINYLGYVSVITEENTCQPAASLIDPLR